MACSDAESFLRSRDEEFLRRRIVLNAQHVWLAAYLAVFDVALPPARGFVDAGGVPLSTACALEACFHKAIMPRSRRRRLSSNRQKFNCPIMAGLSFLKLEAP
jgi:hypothetical protein